MTSYCCACAPTTREGSAPSRRTRPPFVGRLLQHVLPPGFKRIRHYGLLAPTAKMQRLALARKPLANPQAREDARAFMRRVAAIEIERCLHCGLGHWRVVEQRGADRAAIAAPLLAACRGPP